MRPSQLSQVRAAFALFSHHRGTPALAIPNIALRPFRRAPFFAHQVRLEHDAALPFEIRDGLLVPDAEAADWLYSEERAGGWDSCLPLDTNEAHLIVSFEYLTTATAFALRFRDDRA
jgi:hypothetical protein